MNTDVPGSPSPYLGGQKPASRTPEQYEQATSLRSTMWQPPTTPAEPPAEASLAERERTRRGRLASMMILVFLLLWSGDCLYELSRGEAAARPAFLIGLLILGLALLINWRGHVTLVGVLLVVAIYVGYLFPIVVGHQVLDIIDLRTFALLVESILVAAFLLPLFAIPLVTLVNIYFLLVLFFVQPHTSAFTASVQSGVGIRALEQLIGLHILVAVIATAWVRSTARALARAERGELITAMKQREVEEKQVLEAGIQHLLDAQTQAVNGNLQVRTDLGQQHVLWRVGASLNMLLARLQRSAQAELVLHRTEVEAVQLIEAIQDARGGRQPRWPMPSGTPLDGVLHELASNQS